ncbi:MAG: hypothetical protein BWY72_01631 [Bacteroidetes bacterium ADurb.Bin416]|nr:MAG: hypothetical protein BWY72_01631 [Bacteroidetes bacterium ADurb.Bin416]
MWGTFKRCNNLPDRPVEATVRSKTLAMAVLIEPLYRFTLPLTRLSARIRPCLLAGPARYEIIF